MVNIIQNIVPKSKYDIKCPYDMEPIGITVHNTANDASARSEINYMINSDAETSFHFAVDDKEIVQGLPLNRNGWHASDGNGTGNRKTIAIEICYSKSGGEKFIKAEKNACQLIAKLLKEYGWSINAVKRHYDYAPNKKYCPQRTMNMGWDRFLNMVKDNMEENTGTTQKTEVNIEYRVKTLRDNWLPPVKNLQDYAGWMDSPVTAVAIKVDKGSIKYRAHTTKGKWYGLVDGYNIADAKNGYAGDGKNTIDLLEAYYYTPNDIRPLKKVKYRVNNLPWQYDNEKKDGQDGYAGVMGKPITKLEMIIE